jgi:medium-chain acyl-[acyl-carrier-protein] hydrolase
METFRSPSASPWIVRSNGSGSSKSSKMRLICLPYAGGGAGAFFRWSSLVDNAIDVIRIQLPGHETRIREPLLRRSEDVVFAMADALLRFLDRPFFVYGHSMGALLGFELIRKLRADHGIMPVHLFVSSFRAPHLQPVDPPIHELPEDLFINQLQQYGGVPEQILAERELMDLMLPILRADFQILETYVCKEEHALECPITAFGGMHDAKTREHMVTAWQRETSRHFRSLFFTGGHFFINENPLAVISVVNEEFKSFLRNR